jgi:hypothetical protein
MIFTENSNKQLKKQNTKRKKKEMFNVRAHKIGTLVKINRVHQDFQVMDK